MSTEGAPRWERQLVFRFSSIQSSFSLSYRRECEEAAVRGQRLIEQWPCQQVHFEELVFCEDFEDFSDLAARFDRLVIGLSESRHVHLTESRASAVQGCLMLS
jgi:hypothetical protein